MVSTITGMSLEDFTRLYDEEGPFELVNGERIALSPNKIGHVNVATRLLYAILNFTLPRGLGQAYAEAAFVVDLTENWVRGSRVPDILYIRAERFAAYKRANPDWEDKPLVLIPDLVVEIVSPTDSYTDINAKIASYLADGVQLAWVLDQKRHTVAIHQPGSNQITVLTADQTLTGGSVIEGFEMKVAELFE